jgi:hypothetical protein
MVTSTVQKSLSLRVRRPQVGGDFAGKGEGIQTDPPRRGVISNLGLEFFVMAIPALWLGSLIFRYGVNSPWGDQWDGTFPLFAKMQAGTLKLTDFVSFHSEHRIVFPNLLIFFLAKLTHWNIRAELFVIWVLTCVCGFNVWRIGKLTCDRNKPAHIVLLLAASMLIFTPLQWENLLWGFQIAFLLPLACTTAVPWVAFSARFPLNLIWTLILCVVSTFSVASGFVAWLLAGALLLLANDKPKSKLDFAYWISWTCLGCCSIALCFYGFRQPGWHPDESAALRHPIVAAEFALSYIGYPFAAQISAHRAALAAAAGGLLVAFLALILFYLWRNRTDRALLRRAAPWLALVGITLSNCLLTLLGRVGFGITAAMQSRYVSFAMFLPIGLLFLGAQVIDHQSSREHPSGYVPKWILVVVAGFAGALGLLFFLGTIRILPFWRVMQHERLSGKAVLLLSNVIDEPGARRRYLHPNPALKEWAVTLDQIGYIQPPPLRSNHVREIARSAHGESVGALQRMQATPDGRLTLEGWAILPWKHRVADSILLTSEDEMADPVIFARADVKGRREDVVEQFVEAAYLNCGWTKLLSREEIPKGAHRLNAWAFDAEDCHAFLIGSASF